MESMSAFEYAMGVYGLSIIVTLLVWLVIIGIRWLSRERGRTSMFPPVSKNQTQEKTHCSL